tara:strand:+ start:278 stop:937 length:660 start_codon:yes stop_codon:yes gene_type:complete
MALTGLTEIQFTNLNVTGVATFAQTVGIAGTLTYEDVTNIDSVGVVTARVGVNVPAGQLDVGSNVKIGHSGVTTASNFKTGSTNVHSVGVEAAGINVLGADTPIGAGATIYNSGGAIFAGTSGVVTATAFHGSGANLTSIPAAQLTGTLPALDGSNLTGLAGREVYGFTGIGNSLSLTTTNGGADNITNATYVAFEESFIGPSGLSFSINTSGNLIMTV